VLFFSRAGQPWVRGKAGAGTRLFCLRLFCQRSNPGYGKLFVCYESILTFGVKLDCVGDLLSCDSNFRCSGAGMSMVTRTEFFLMNVIIPFRAWDVKTG
jgi:hypothetical protein